MYHSATLTYIRANFHTINFLPFLLLIKIKLHKNNSDFMESV